MQGLLIVIEVNAQEKLKQKFVKHLIHININLEFKNPLKPKTNYHVFRFNF